MKESMQIAIWIWDTVGMGDSEVWQGMWLYEAADKIEEIIQSIEDKT